MNFTIRNVTWTGCCILVLLALACGGGGVGDLAGGGTGGTGMSMGPADSYGSIEVNGTHFSTGNAEIFVEGQSRGTGDQALMDNIALGMVVRVDGDFGDSQDGTARKIYFNDDIRGPVDSIREIDRLTTELIVLDQEILLTDITQTGDIDVADLELGEWVSISGFNDAAGRMIASYIAITDSNEGANIKGTVTQLNTTDTYFAINGMRIDYQDAAFTGLTQPSEGLQVEVTGTLSDDYLSIAAATIELVDRFGVTDSETIEIAGVVLEVISETRLLLDSVSVTMNDQTDFIGGELQELTDGVRVEVEGELVDGALNAEKIIFLDNAKVESDVVSNQKTQSSLELAGLSEESEYITILYNEITKVTGAVKTTEDITNDHHVKIIGRQTSENTMLAIHIIVKSSPNSTVKLQGLLESIQGEEIAILGQTVDLSDIPDENFESPEGVSVDRTEFLDSIDTGDLISIKGEQTDGIITWQSATAE